MNSVVRGAGQGLGYQSLLSDLGISLPGSGEAPAAPVFIDGEKRMTLRGDRIAEEFQVIVENYIENRFGRRSATAEAA